MQPNSIDPLSPAAVPVIGGYPLKVARRPALAPPADVPLIDTLRPLLVVGGCGGAGTTSVALGLASSAALACANGWPVVVDATAAGGDAAARGGDDFESATTMQGWLSVRDAPSPTRIENCCSRASSGALILGRDATELPWRASFLTVAALLRDGGYTPIFDGGSAAWARHLVPLLTEASLRLVVVIPARADAANRLRRVLDWLDREVGSHAMSAAQIVVSSQTGLDDAQVAGHLRRWLDDAVGAVVEIPYDPHLALGDTVTWGHLNERTRAAYTALLVKALA